MTNPTEIFFFFQVGLEEFAGGPITHGRKCYFTFDKFLNGLVPGQSRMIRIYISLHFCKQLHCLFHVGIVPLQFALE
jgi:hypothetical protein